VKANRIFVIGRFSRTTYGPFGSEPLAQSFIRTELGSSTRFYETAVEPPKAARAKSCNGMVLLPWSPKGSVRA